jgi:hypothetical protein
MLLATAFAILKNHILRIRHWFMYLQWKWFFYWIEINIPRWQYSSIYCVFARPWYCTVRLVMNSILHSIEIYLLGYPWKRECSEFRNNVQQRKISIADLHMSLLGLFSNFCCYLYLVIIYCLELQSIEYVCIKLKCMTNSAKAGPIWSTGIVIFYFVKVVAGFYLVEVTMSSQLLVSK